MNRAGENTILNKGAKQNNVNFEEEISYENVSDNLATAVSLVHPTAPVISIQKRLMTQPLN